MEKQKFAQHYIMAHDPLPDVTASDARERYNDSLSGQDLADALAIISNKFWWIEDEEYDFEEGTAEYKKACAITDEWGDLMDDFKARVFAILIKEGIKIPESGQRAVLAPFMKKYGYDDKGGWWIKD